MSRPDYTASALLDERVLDVLSRGGALSAEEVATLVFGAGHSRGDIVDVASALRRLNDRRALECCYRSSGAKGQRRRAYYALPGVFAALSRAADPNDLARPRQINVLALPVYQPGASMLRAARPGADDHRKHASRGVRC